MASYNIASGAIAVHDKTLVASTIDTITFADDPKEVEIISDGTAKIYVSVDGTNPTVSGEGTYIIPATPCVRRIRHWRTSAAIKLISTGTPTYSVTVA